MRARCKRDWKWGNVVNIVLGMRFWKNKLFIFFNKGESVEAGIILGFRLWRLSGLGSVICRVVDDTYHPRSIRTVLLHSTGAALDLANTLDAGNKEDVLTKVNLQHWRKLCTQSYCRARALSSNKHREV